MPETVETPHQLLAHELGEMLYVEQAQSREVLPKMAKEVRNEELRRGLVMHARQSREQRAQLEKAFKLIGEKAQPQPNAAFDGLRSSHDEMVRNITNDALRDVFDADAAAKAEHLEVASYRGMIALAEQLNESELVDLLRGVEQQEQQMAEELERVTRQLGGEIAATG